MMLDSAVENKSVIWRTNRLEPAVAAVASSFCMRHRRQKASLLRSIDRGPDPSNEIYNRIH